VNRDESLNRRVFTWRDYSSFVYFGQGDFGRLAAEPRADRSNQKGWPAMTMLALALFGEAASGHLEIDPIDGDQRASLFAGEVSSVQFPVRVGLETRSRVCVDIEMHQEVFERSGTHDTAA